MYLNLNRSKYLNFGAMTLALCVLLSGCASVPKMEADKTSISKIKRIAIISIPEPRNVQIINIGGVAGGFGLVGGLVQGEMNAAHGKHFADLLNYRSPKLSEALYTELAHSLKSDGFQVVDARNQKPKVASDGRSDDFSDIHVDADAFLAVWYGVVGYVSEQYSTHYEPWVFMKARLIDGKTKQDIYFKSFGVGYVMKIKNAVFFPADMKYRYSNYDDIMAHSSNAITGLYDSQEVVIQHIASDLKP